MFSKIEIPFPCVMLFNEVKLKDGVKIEDVEIALGELCEVVKDTYGTDDGGFIAGQVYENSGFISPEGSFQGEVKDMVERGELCIVTYWKSFENHEESHAGEAFKKKFSELLEYCSSATEVGYKLLWQGGT